MLSESRFKRETVTALLILRRILWTEKSWTLKSFTKKSFMGRLFLFIKFRASQTGST